MGRMQWRCPSNDDGEKILHLEIEGRWMPYHSTTLGMTMEGLGKTQQMRGVQYSKGWHCFQALHRQGWVLVSSPGVEEVGALIDPIANVRIWARQKLPAQVGFIYNDLLRAIDRCDNKAFKVDCLILGYEIYGRDDLCSSSRAHLLGRLNELVVRNVEMFAGAAL